VYSIERVKETENKAGKALKAIKLRLSLASTVCLMQRYRQHRTVKRAGEKNKIPC
jgi:hypothetical protein